jgi:hypothetical protein
MYDLKQRTIMISGEEDLLRILTKQPLLYNRNSGVVLAIYRINPADDGIYYTEKRDYYNLDYSEDYAPDFEEMLLLYQPDSPLSWQYDPEIGGVLVIIGEKEYEFYPRSLPLDKSLSGLSQE